MTRRYTNPRLPLPLHLATTVIYSNIQSGPENKAQSLITAILQLFAVQSRSFHQNAQKRSMSTSLCKICISWLNIV